VCMCKHANEPKNIESNHRSDVDDVMSPKEAKLVLCTATQTKAYRLIHKHHMKTEYFAINIVFFVFSTLVVAQAKLNRANMSAENPSLKRDCALRRVGIVGYGSLGQFLAKAIITDPVASKELALSFVWNRTEKKIQDDIDAGVLPEGVLLKDLNKFGERGVDLIVEVAHSTITATMGSTFLSKANYMVGSPTCFSDKNIEGSIRAQLAVNLENNVEYGAFIPAGALWGANDIQKMADRGSLKGLGVTMKFGAQALRLQGELKKKLEKIVANGYTEEKLLYDGPIRDLCPMAPNNVNTIACAALAGHNIGFDNTRAQLYVAAPDLHAHIVEVHVEGPGGFKADTVRHNPAKVGAVTGNATYNSFLSSMLAAAKMSKGGSCAGRMTFV